jgi:hypothetical protein
MVVWTKARVEKLVPRLVLTNTSRGWGQIILLDLECNHDVTSVVGECILEKRPHCGGKGSVGFKGVRLTEMMERGRAEA